MRLDAAAEVDDEPCQEHPMEVNGLPIPDVHPPKDRVVCLYERSYPPTFALMNSPRSQKLSVALKQC
jgi:hypothetical protein